MTDRSRRCRYDDDKPKEECGIFAVFGHRAMPPPHAALGLHALQHRGQEAAGIVSFDGQHFHSHRAVGLIGDTFSRRSVIEGLPGPRRDRPRPLLDHRRQHAAQRAAAVRRLRLRRPRGRAQRQPHQRHAPAPAAGRGGLAVPVDQRHRGDHPPDRAQPAPEHRRAAWSTRCARSRAPGRWSALFDDGILGGRDPAGRAAAGARPARRRLDPGLGDLRARHHGCGVRARRRARRDRGHRRATGCAACARSRPSRAASASSSMSTSPGRTAWSRAWASTTSGSGSARSSRARAACRPTSSCRCPTAACRRRSATPRNPASPSSSASSATTMSAAPSSSRPTTSAISA